MKESIANSAVFTIIIVCIGLVTFIFLSSLNYSKAFKLKNKMVDIIENYDDGYAPANREAINAEIEESLKQIGYRVNNGKGCPNREGAKNKGQALNDTKNYRYCIYEEENGRGTMYYVIAYMYYDIPIIDQMLEFPIAGQTKVFYQVID